MVNEMFGRESTHVPGQINGEIAKYEEIAANICELKKIFEME